MRMPTTSLGSIVLLAALTACSKPPSPAAPTAPAQPQAVAELPADVSATLDQFQASLKQRLLQAIQAGGPENALDVCRAEAGSLTQQAQRPDLAVGRTSHRLRNPANTPPTWAARIVADGEGRKVQGPPPRYQVELASGKQGYLQGIPTVPLCVTCHGPPDGLAPSLKQKLTFVYPQDQATGFQVGDLRGWFWVERR